MHQAIDYIDKVSGDGINVVDASLGQIGNNGTLENTVIRPSKSFLTGSGKDRVYWTVTTEGYIKCVRIDHSREKYHRKAETSFHTTVDLLMGSFVEDVGRVKI